MSRRLVYLIVLFGAALLLRIYRLDQVPASLYYDEVDYGYQARSLLTTGRDYRGSLSPFYVHSFNDIRTPIPAYLTVPTTAFFKTPEIQVRLPNALLGTLTCILLALLVFTWTKNYSLTALTALVAAISPWQLQFSRYSHEVMSMAPFYLLGLILFFKFLSSKKFTHYLLAIVFIALTTYTYRTMSLFAPLTLGVLSLLYLKQVWALGLKKLALAVIVAISLIGPFLYFTTLGAADTPRIQQLAITADREVPIWVQRHREVDSHDFLAPTVGKQAARWSYLFHSKPLSWATMLVKNYLHVFSTEFLFISGDINPRHSIGGRGMLYVIDLVALFVGLIYLFRHRQLNWARWLLVWLFLSPIPSALTVDGAAHAGRLFIFSLPLLLTVATGWWQVVTFLPKHFRPIVAVLMGLSLVFYLHRYYVHYPIESARNFGFGFKQSVSVISDLQSQFDHVYLTAVKDPPMPYLLFWTNWPPRNTQEYGTNFSSSHPGTLGKYSVLEWKADSLLQPGALYLVTPTEFPVDFRDAAKVPKHIQLHQIIKYPDNEVAFYVLSLRH